MKVSDIEVLPIEGEAGIRGLCKLARELGYKDPNYQLQLSTGECIGDLLYMLRDNPCMIEAIHTCVIENLASNLEDEDEDEDEEVEIPIGMEDLFH